MRKLSNYEITTTCRGRFLNFLLQKIGNVPSRASGPCDANGVHFESRRHHVQGVAVPLAAPDFFRIVVHAETGHEIELVNHLAEIETVCHANVSRLEFQMIPISNNQLSWRYFLIFHSTREIIVKIILIGFKINNLFE